MRLKHPETPDTRKWEVYEKLLEVKRRTIYIWGRPGIGKTWLSYHHGIPESQEMCAITLTDETPASELRGHYLLDGKGQMVWHHGPFTMAMVNGWRLVINEIGQGNDDVQGILGPFLEDPSTARITLPSGETVVPAEGFHIIATDNFAPDKLPERLKDRFQVQLKLDAPHPAALADLPPEFWIAAIKPVDNDEFGAISVRQWNALVVNDADFGFRLGCELTWGEEMGNTIHNNLTWMWNLRVSGEVDRTDDTSVANVRERARHSVLAEYGTTEGIADGA